LPTKEEKTEIFECLAKAIVDHDPDETLKISREGIKQGVDPVEMIQKGLSTGMKRVSELFERAEYPLPFVLLAAKAMTLAIDQLKPHILKGRAPKPIGKIVLSVVKGDIHELGAKILKPLLETAGFEVHYVGVDVPAETIIEEAERLEADIIALSAFMVTTMIEQDLLIRALKKKGLREKYKVMVGGGPVSDLWCEKIGADGYAPDAISAVEKAKELMKQKRASVE